jgi:hypothetical protein
MIVTLSSLYTTYKQFSDKIEQIQQDLLDNSVESVKLDVLTNEEIPVEEFIKNHKHYEEVLLLID